MRASLDASAPPILQRQYVPRAMEFYETAALQMMESGGSPSSFHLTNANLAVRLSDPQAVVPYLERAITSVPVEERWKMEQRLARAHWKAKP